MFYDNIYLEVINMRLINKNLIEIKKSKFYGYYYEVDTTEEVDNILKEIKKEHKKARHVCYGYKIDNLVKRTDDGEPSGTAGIPIFTIIEKKELNHILIIVVRYFGGIKLGAGGLFRAYMQTSNELVK